MRNEKMNLIERRNSTKYHFNKMQTSLKEIDTCNDIIDKWQNIPVTNQ